MDYKLCAMQGLRDIKVGRETGGIDIGYTISTGCCTLFAKCMGGLYRLEVKISDDSTAFVDELCELIERNVELTHIKVGFVGAKFQHGEEVDVDLDCEVCSTDEDEVDVEHHVDNPVDDHVDDHVNDHENENYVDDVDVNDDEFIDDDSVAAELDDTFSRAMYNYDFDGDYDDEEIAMVLPSKSTITAIIRILEAVVNCAMIREVIVDCGKLTDYAHGIWSSIAEVEDLVSCKLRWKCVYVQVLGFTYDARCNKC